MVRISQTVGIASLMAPKFESFPIVVCYITDDGIILVSGFARQTSDQDERFHAHTSGKSHGLIASIARIVTKSSSKAACLGT